MSNEELIKRYFKWLLSLIANDSNEFSCRLMWKLLTVEYIPGKIFLDENRASDGLVLRDRFSFEHPELSDLVSTYLNGPCTMLEMLVALSIKAEDTTIGNNPELYFPGRWFFLMINNLGLANQMVDQWYDDNIVDEILGHFMTRTYKKNGEGGLFRIQSDKVDMRRIDIWRQFNVFLLHSGQEI